MGMRGKALVFPEPNKADIWEFDLPELQDGEVLIEIEYSGVSTGTERQIYLGQDKRAVFPVVTGYQSVGKVLEFKGKCPGIEIGDRVLVGSTKKAPKMNLCWGSHVSHAIMDHQNLVKCKKSIKPEVAALSWVAGVGRYGVAKSEVKHGDIVVVNGQGIIGQMAAQMSKIWGAKKVLASDVLPYRVELSKKYSADECIDSTNANFKEYVKRIYPDGVDVVLESTGISRLIIDCLKMVKLNGTFCFQGWYPGEIIFPFEIPHEKQMKMVFPFAWDGNRALMHVLDLLENGKLNIEPLISHKIKYDDAPRIYPDLVKGVVKEVMGIVIDWR